MISTVSHNQDQCIQDILSLHCSQGIELDPTFSKGVFYRNIQRPRLRFDLEPQIEGVTQADCRNLPIKPASIQSIMFDPPFVGGSRKDGKPGIIKTRFGYYKNVPILWAMYKDALKEFHRILKENGILIFKCQDTVESGKQWMSHIRIMIDAVRIGFYPKDLFILVAKNRLMSPNMANQQHARKFHSYFWVFQKKHTNIPYEIGEYYED